jgi:hypothetical protein
MIITGACLGDVVKMGRYNSLSEWFTCRLMFPCVKPIIMYLDNLDVRG